MTIIIYKQITTTNGQMLWNPTKVTRDRTSRSLFRNFYVHFCLYITFIFLFDPHSSAVSALSTTVSKGSLTGVVKSQPGTTWHFILSTGLPFICFSSPQAQRCCLCLYTQTPYQLPSVCSCDSHTSQCSPHWRSTKPLIPTSIAKNPIVHPFCWMSYTSSRYFRVFFYFVYLWFKDQQI